MTIGTHLNARTDIRALIAALPDDMTSEESALSDLAKEVYDIPAPAVEARLRPLLDAIKARCGRSPGVPADFPQAKDARKVIFRLEDLINDKIG